MENSCRRKVLARMIACTVSLTVMITTLILTSSSSAGVWRYLSTGASSSAQLVAASRVMISVLTGHSPWSGKWGNRYAQGTMTIEFTSNAGNLAGAMTALTGSSWTLPLPLELEILSVGNEKIKFRNPKTGAEYDLKLMGSEMLAGTFKFESSSGTLWGKVALSPGRE